jgi:Na+-driven multidrug efflux pump
MGYGAAGLWMGLVAGSIIGMVMMSYKFRSQFARADIRLS